jgi:hypothetical protein
MPPPNASGAPVQSQNLWDGTTASIGLPKGSPQPPAKFTPFIGATPRGDIGNWGKPDPYGATPQSFELPTIYRTLGQFFGQSNGAAGPLGMLIAGHAGAYMKGLMLGQEFASKQAREQLLQKSLELQQQQEEWHTQYADEYAKFALKAGTNDPAKIATTTINGRNLYDTYADIAYRTGDKDVEGMLEDGMSMDKIVRYQDFRDSKLKDLQKANAKLTEQDKEDKGWEEGSGESGGAQPGQPSSPLAPPPEQPTPAQPGAAPAAPQGGTPPTAVARANPLAPPGQEGQEQQGAPVLNADQRAGLEFARGGAADALPKGEHGGIAKGYANQLLGKLTDLNGRSQGMTEDQALQELQRINPAMASDARGLLNGAPVPGGWSQVGSRPYWKNLVDILQNVRPGYVPQTAEETKTFLNQYDEAGIRNTYQRTYRMGPTGKVLLSAVNKAVDAGQLGTEPFKNKWNDWVNHNLEANDVWAGIFNGLEQYTADSLAIANQGKPYAGDVRRLMDQQWNVNSPQAIRTILQQDAEIAGGAVKPLEDAYLKRMKKNSPFYNADAMREIADMAKLRDDGSFDPTLPDDSPLKSVERKPGQGGGSKLPPGWTVTPIQ